MYKILLYIVIATIASSCNMSIDYAHYYVESEQIFNENINIINYQNKRKIDDFIYLREHTVKLDTWINLMNNVKNTSDSLFYYIDSLKLALKIQATNFTDNRIVLKNKEMERFKEKYISYIEKQRLEFENIRDQYFIDFVDSMLSKEIFNDIDIFKGVSTEYYEASAILSAIQMDIKLIEADFINYYYSQVDVASFRYIKIEPIVKPNSKIINIGDKYSAEIFLAATDTTDTYKRTINGKEYPTSNGRLYYSEKVNSNDSLVIKKAFMSLTRKGKEYYRLPFEIIYKIIEN